MATREHKIPPAYAPIDDASIPAPEPKRQTWPRRIARLLLGGGLIFAGWSHLTSMRQEFQAQVPDFATELTGMSTDDVVVASGVVEIALGAALVLTPPRMRKGLGVLAAIFFVAVFPGNFVQWHEGRSAFGLDTDEKRFIRLFFQPLLVAWALWATRPGRDKH